MLSKKPLIRPLVRPAVSAVNSHGPAFNKPVVRPKPTGLVNIAKHPNFHSNLAGEARPTVRPKPAMYAPGIPNQQYRDATYLGQEHYAKGELQHDLGDMLAGIDALNARDKATGMTMYENQMKNNQNWRAADSSQAGANLAGAGMLFSGQRQNLNQAREAEFASRYSDAYNSVGKGAEDQIRKSIEERNKDYHNQLSDFAFEAQERARQEGGALYVAPKKPTVKPKKPKHPNAKTFTNGQGQVRPIIKKGKK